MNHSVALVGATYPDLNSMGLVVAMNVKDDIDAIGQAMAGLADAKDIDILNATFLERTNSLGERMQALYSSEVYALTFGMLMKRGVFDLDHALAVLYHPMLDHALPGRIDLVRYGFDAIVGLGGWYAAWPFGIAAQDSPARVAQGTTWLMQALDEIELERHQDSERMLEWAERYAWAHDVFLAQTLKEGLAISMSAHRALLALPWKPSAMALEQLASNFLAFEEERERAGAHRGMLFFRKQYPDVYQRMQTLVVQMGDLSGVTPIEQARALALLYLQEDHGVLADHVNTAYALPKLT